MALVLYLAVILIAALLLGLTWVAAMWGIGPVALSPLYLVGFIIAASLIFWAKRIRKLPHA